MSRDYADWLTDERLAVEEKAWAEARFYERYGAAVMRVAREYGVRSVEEYGCGTGWVPTVLDGAGLAYRGYDRNPGCLRLAREKNAQRSWVQFLDAEIREAQPVADLVCSFAVLKHFGLDEWESVFRRIFGSAVFGLFTIPIADQPRSDETEFTHVWLSEARLAEILKSCGLRELWRDATPPIDAIEPIIAVARAA